MKSRALVEVGTTQRLIHPKDICNSRGLERILKRNAPTT